MMNDKREIVTRLIACEGSHPESCGVSTISDDAIDTVCHIADRIIAATEPLIKVSEMPPTNITGGMDSVDYVRRIREGEDENESLADDVDEAFNELSRYLHADWPSGGRYLNTIRVALEAKQAVPERPQFEVVPNMLDENYFYKKFEVDDWLDSLEGGAL